MNIQHLSLKERKILSAKVIFLESRLVTEQKFIFNPQQYLQLNGLTDAILEFLSWYKQGLEDSTALDIYLKEIHKIFIAQIRLYLSSHTEIVEDFLKNIHTKMNKIECINCSSPRICNGSINDDDIVKTHGLCILPFHNMFSSVKDALQTYYKTYSSLPNSIKLPEIYLSMSRTKSDHDKPHDYEINYYVSGATSFGIYSQTTYSIVEIIINISKFDKGTYEAILYVMFHELFVHAFHSILSPIQRIQPTGDDSFSEGWMEWVSLEIMSKILKGKGAVGCKAEVIDFNATRQAGERFHLAKLDYNSDYQNNSHHIYSGKEAAERVFNVISSKSKDETEVWGIFLKLSFDLNLYGHFPEAQRNIFISKLHYLIQNEKLQQIKSPKHYIVAGYLSAYLMDRDIQKLIDSVCNIK